MSRRKGGPQGRGKREEALAALRAVRSLEPRTAPRSVPKGWRPGLADRDPLVRHVLEQMRAVVVDAEAGGRVRYVSSTFDALLGYAPEELVGREGLEWIHDDDLPRLVELARELRETGTSAPVSYRARHKSGHWVWLETSSVVSYRPAEGDWHTLSLTRDVTDMKRSEEALRSSEERYRTLAENASDLIFELDAAGRMLFASPNMRAMLGRDADQLVGSALHEGPIADTIHPDDLEHFLGGFEQLVTTGHGSGQAVYRVRHADGSWLWLEARTATYRRNDGELRAVVVARNVTERERAHRKLRESEERYRILAQASHDLITETDAEGRCVFASHIEGTFLGHDPVAFAGTTPFTLIHPDDVERVVEAFFQSQQTSGAVQLAPFRLRRRDGSWAWLESSGFAYRNAAGELRTLSVTRDVSERVRAEEERRALAERMQQAQKLESLGVMAGGIAHDFNNLLTPILGDASLSLLDLPPDSPLRSRLRRIQKAARRAAGLTNQMLAYAGADALQTEFVQLPELVREMGQLLESAVSRNIVLDYDLPEALPPIEADPAQLSQVVMNLITNASEAIGDAAGRISMRMGTLEARLSDLRRAVFGNELPEGRYVYFEVADDGCGMDEKTRPRIFDPFFTTKFTGRGLGLAAVLGIVRGHEGAIEIDSSPGLGTRVRVLFPCAKGAPAARAREVAGVAAWRGEGTVLVVDDDEGARDVIFDTLGRAGLRVLCAVNGREGIEVLRRHRNEIRVVVLDRTMPIASGEQTFELVRRTHPTVPILLVSGYSEKRATDRLADAGLAGFLQKPFQPEQLLEQIRRLIESQPGA